MSQLNRRDFMVTTAGVSFAATTRPASRGPAIQTPNAARPVVVSSANGHKFKKAARRRASRSPSSR